MSQPVSFKQFNRYMCTKTSCTEATIEQVWDRYICPTEETKDSFEWFDTLAKFEDALRENGIDEQPDRYRDIWKKFIKEGYVVHIKPYSKVADECNGLPPELIRMVWDKYIESFSLEERIIGCEQEIKVHYVGDIVILGRAWHGGSYLSPIPTNAVEDAIFEYAIDDDDCIIFHPGVYPGMWKEIENMKYILSYFNFDEDAFFTDDNIQDLIDMIIELKRLYLID